jgi:deoxyadenosine/deoxycytidine kinase
MHKGTVMVDKKSDKILQRLKETGRRTENTDETEPHVLVEILYEYLSEHISTHFEKTIEGIDTLHNSLRARQHEHTEILARLDKLDERLRQIETLIAKE